MQDEKNRAQSSGKALMTNAQRLEGTAGLTWTSGGERSRKNQEASAVAAQSEQGGEQKMRSKRFLGGPALVKHYRLL